MKASPTTGNQDAVWPLLREEVAAAVDHEPILETMLTETVLQHQSFDDALIHHLTACIHCGDDDVLIPQAIRDAISSDPAISQSALLDLAAVVDRDSACHQYSVPFLYFKGFHALQAYRVAHWLWQQGRQSLALLFQNRISAQFGVDIHPAARIGHGIMFDHANGIVIGETAVVGNNVSIMQSVTLGGTGKEEGDRHPKVGDGVLISAGAKILGNIVIGEGAKVGAGSVVLQAVPPHTTVAGVPATIVGHPQTDQPALDMNHQLNCDLDNN